MKLGPPSVRAERLAVLPARVGFRRIGDTFVCRGCGARLRVLGVVDAKLMEHGAGCELGLLIASFQKPVFLSIKPAVLS